MAKADGRGKNPNSIAALNREGRSPEYGETKARRVYYLTDDAVNGLQSMANDLGYRSISDFLQKLGSKEIDADAIADVLQQSDRP